MAKSATQVLDSGARSNNRALEWPQQITIVVAASLFVAVCAHITLPLPFTPVPLTLQNFGVLVVGLTLGWRRGFAALALYLAEGAMGMPVFSPTGPGGVAQLFGLTGGFLMAYPFVAALAGWVLENGEKTFVRAAVAGVLAEILLFACGVTWLSIYTHSFSQALRMGLRWFIFAEVIKVMFAAAVSTGWERAFEGRA
jgi:biotin transport system substrate-specific component